MRKKIALITGITGQDGAYLVRLLLSKNYKVYGIKRRSSMFNTQRIDELYRDPKIHKTDFQLLHGDMLDSSNVMNIVQKTQPNEIYNLAAQSHVEVSFHQPEYTANVNGLGTLRLLEAIRTLKLSKKTRFYQASTSEMFGGYQLKAYLEKSMFNPKSPYAASKLFSYWITKIYREAYGVYACNGILFNHESPMRGETFVSRKITRGLCKIKLGFEKKLILGNLNATRDWGHAKDYVLAQWKMLQINKPMDLIIATGKSYSIRHFVIEAGKNLGMKIEFKGKGLNEKGFDQNGKVIVEVSKDYFRPLEVENLKGNYYKAKKILNWKPSTNFKSLVKEMINEDLKKIQYEQK